MARNVFLVFAVVLVTALAAVAFAGQKTSFDFKTGDEAYVCNCGAACPCNTISNNPGNCTCGKEMVKAKVIRTEAGTAVFRTEGWNEERVFKTSGKYACACGPACPCNTISQNPGKCTCNVDMKKAGS